MLLLTSTSDLIQVITSGSQTVHVHASYIDLSGSTVTPGRKNTIITSSTTTTAVASPGASTQRDVKTISIRNADLSSSAADTVTVQHTDGTNVTKLITLPLNQNWTITWTAGLGWLLTNPFGITMKAAA